MSQIGVKWNQRNIYIKKLATSQPLQNISCWMVNKMCKYIIPTYLWVNLHEITDSELNLLHICLILVSPT